MSDQAPRAGAEAAKLLAAAQEWLRTSAPHLAPVDADGETCSCPVCRGIVRLRETDPDSVARWVDGAVAAVEHVLGEAAAGVAQATGGTAPTPTTATSAQDPVPPAGEDDDAAAPEQPGADDASTSGHDDARTRRVRRIPIDDATDPGTSPDPGPATSRSGG
jgi:hypothetical protein